MTPRDLIPGSPEWLRWFYRSRGWQLTREAVLVRDNHLCQTCLRKGILTPTRTVHHIKPLEEAPELGLVMDNLESICPACHNLAHPGKGFGNKDLRRQIVVILGYPASGKSTYVKRRMGEYDMVLDIDLLTSAVTGRPPHDRTGSAEHAWRMANDMMSHVLKRVRSRGYVFDTLWVIRTRLNNEEYAALRAARARMYWLDVDKETCLARLKEQGRDMPADVFDKGDEFMRQYGARIRKIQEESKR